VNLVLFLSLMLILAAALPWFPYSPSARLRHHRQWVSPTRAGTKCTGQPAPVASQKPTMKLEENSAIDGIKTSTAGLAVSLFLLWIFDTETWLQRTLLLSIALALSLFLFAMFGNRKKAYSTSHHSGNPSARRRGYVRTPPPKIRGGDSVQRAPKRQAFSIQI